MADWIEIRKLYETTGSTQSSLAKQFGISRQAVSTRCKKESWIVGSVVDTSVDNEPEVDEPVDTPLTVARPVSGSRVGLRCDDNISTIIDTYALTGNKAMSCRRVGIDDQTLTNWCKEEPQLSVMMQASRDAHLIGQYTKIANAKDWKAAKEILARAPETKDEWGEVHDSGPKIILNIHRDEVIIEQ